MSQPCAADCGCGPYEQLTKLKRSPRWSDRSCDRDPNLAVPMPSVAEARGRRQVRWVAHGLGGRHRAELCLCAGAFRVLQSFGTGLCRLCAGFVPGFFGEVPAYILFL